MDAYNEINKIQMLLVGAPNHCKPHANKKYSIQSTIPSHKSLTITKIILNGQNICLPPVKTILKRINGQITILNSIGRTVTHVLPSIGKLTSERPRGFLAKAVRLEVERKELLVGVAGQFVHFVFTLSNI
jgi:hypothetical protein